MGPVAHCKAPKTHARYNWWATEDRPDLAVLALCNNLKGPVYAPALLTADVTAVTCGRCRRIIGEERLAQALRIKQVSPFIGKEVRLLPMEARSRSWSRRFGEVVTLVKWDAETVTVRGKRRSHATFGPHEVCWQEIRR